MNWLARWLGLEFATGLTHISLSLADITRQQAEIIKVLGVINQSVAKLVLEKAQQPEELTNVERAALLGLPPSMAELVDWQQLGRGRR